MVLVPAQPRDRVPAYLAASDLIVLPQKDVPESRGQMPAKLTEAMAMGKPIIATALSDIPRYLEGCGWVVPPDDVDALAARIGWVASHLGEARAHGARARERFLRDFTYDAMLRIMEPEINRALARAGAAGSLSRKQA
jgi:glycosyltransferase involved in cell wall biosynthesis